MSYEAYKNAYNRCHAVVDAAMDVNLPEPIEFATDEERAERRPKRRAVFKLRKQIEAIEVPAVLSEYQIRIKDVLRAAGMQVESLLDEDDK